MKKINNILIVGVGGQGTILAGDILSEAAIRHGYDVKKSEIHGMSQRGGSVFCHVRFGDKVYSPMIPKGETDTLISFEEMESARWVEYLKPESRLILLAHRILPDGVEIYPEGLVDELRAKLASVQVFDPKKTTHAIGNVKVLNIFTLGVLASSLDIMENEWLQSIEKRVPRGTFEDNKKAFLEGLSYAS